MKLITVLIIIASAISSVSSPGLAAAKQNTCTERLSPYTLPKDLDSYKESSKCSRFLLEKGLNQMEGWMKKDKVIESQVTQIVTDALSKKLSEDSMKKYGEDQGILIALRYLRSVIDYCLCLDEGTVVGSGAQK